MVSRLGAQSSISPDGRFIVFESGSRGQWDIEVLTAALTLS